MFHVSKIDQSHIPIISVNNSPHNQRGGVGGVYQASAVLKVSMTTRDDWIIKVSICGFCGEFRLLSFGDSSEDDVVSRMKRNETTIERINRTLNMEDTNNPQRLGFFGCEKGLKVIKMINLREQEQYISIHLRFTNFLPRHSQVSDEIVILASPACNLNDLRIVAWIIGAGV